MGLTRAEKQRLYRQRQKAKGLCQSSSCQNRPEMQRTLCSRHLEMFRAMHRRRRERCRRAGICLECCQRPWIEGLTRCEVCRLRRIKTNRPPLPLLRIERNVRRAEIAVRKLEEQQRHRAKVEAELIDIQKYMHALSDDRAIEILLLRRRPQPITLKQIGITLGITRERVRQLDRNAMAEIRVVKRRGDRLDERTKLADVQLSTRLTNMLRRVGIKTVGQLAKTDRTMLMSQHGFGITCATEVQTLLEQAGMLAAVNADQKARRPQSRLLRRTNVYSDRSP